MTDVSTTWAEVIFRVKWTVFVIQWCYKVGLLNVIGQFSHDGEKNHDNLTNETDGNAPMTDDKLYMSLSANTIMAKLTNHI